MRPVPPATACTRIKSPALTGYTCRISTCAVIPCGPGTFEARDKGKRLRVVSGAVINVNVVEACRRLAQAHLTRPGLTDIDRCPVQNLGTARLPNLDRMRHTDFRKNMNSLISSCKTENSTTSLLSRLWCHLSTILLFVGTDSFPPLAAGDSWERIESPAEGAQCAYGGWGWCADGG